MARGQPYVFAELGRGENRELAPYSLREGEARDGLNVNTSTVGTVQKRLGCPTFATPSAAVTSLFACHGTTNYLIAAEGTKLRSVTTAGAMADLKTGLTAGARWDFLQAPRDAVSSQGPIYCMNGVDAPLYWDMASTTTVCNPWTANTGSLPNGKFSTYHDNRVFVAGTSANPNTLYWSDIVKPRDWLSPNGGSTQIDPEDGLAITGIGKVGPYLLVFKPRKTYLVIDSNTGAYRRVNTNIGCVANRSIVETESGTYFLSEDMGVVLTDGNSFQSVSLPMRSLLNQIPPGSLANACAIFKDNSYYLSFTTGTQNDYIIQYDTLTQSWWIHQIYYTNATVGGVNDWTILNPSTTATLYAAGADASAFRIFEMFKPSIYQDSNNIDYLANWIGPHHTFGQPHIRKRCREIRVDGYGAFQVYTQRRFSTANTLEEDKIWEASDAGTTFGGTDTFGGGGTFGDSPVVTEHRYYTPTNTVRAISVKFQSQNNQDMKIYAYTMFMDMRKD